MPTKHKLVATKNRPVGVICWMGTFDGDPAVITADRDSADLSVFKKPWFGKGEWVRVKEYKCLTEAKSELQID